MNGSQTGKLIRNLTLRQLQIFDTVVRTGGITRAAEALHLSQPTVSMQVRKMSETLGLELLEQVGRTVNPTAAGQEVFETAQDILESINSLGDLAAELKSEVKGELRVSVITTATYFMPHLFGAFIERFPDVVPKLTITNRAEVLERLRDVAQQKPIRLATYGRCTPWVAEAPWLRAVVGGQDSSRLAVFVGG